MALTLRQLAYYRGLWAEAQKVLRAQGLSSKECEQRRHELHVQALGYDKSSKDLTSDEFTKVKAAFLAITKPDDMTAQLAAGQNSQHLWLESINRLMIVLRVDRAYVQQIASTMNRGGRIGQPWKEKRSTHFDYAHTSGGKIARRELLLEELDAAELFKVFIALKKQCRRKWETKPDLLGAIYAFTREHDIDDQAARTAICRELRLDAVPPLDRQTYETLLAVYAAIRPLARFED